VSDPVRPEIASDAITPEDVERARVAWERAQLPTEKRLLDADKKADDDTA
jgi:hypothetical protein